MNSVYATIITKINKDIIMKKLLIGLTLLTSMSSFATDCRSFNKNDSQLIFDADCNNGEITFESIRIKHEGKKLKLGPVQGLPAKYFCEKLGLDYVSYEVKEYLYPRSIAIVQKQKEDNLLVDTVVKSSHEYAAYFALDEVVCK